MSRTTVRRPGGSLRRAPCALHLEALETRTLLSADLYQAFPGLGPSGWIPPDTCGAVGASFVDQSGNPQPGYFLETINMSIAYYRKDTGARTFSQSLGNFFSPLGSVNLVGDPVVVYDDLTGQFVVGVIDSGGVPHRAGFDLAISYNSDLSQGWYMDRYDVYDGIGSSELNDYPKMGFNADAYVISFNMFPNGGSFHVSTLSVDKSSLAGYTNIVPGGSGNSTLVPAVMHDANPGDPEWLVETGSSSTVWLVKMSNVLSTTPTYQTYSVAVPSYASPPNATQPGGGTIPVSGLGTRFYNAAERYGQLVATHTIGSGGVAHARWYQFDISADSPSRVQSADINPGPSVHTYFPTIEINTNGDLGITYIESSPSEYMSMYVAGQAAGDPLGTMQVGVASHPGTSHYSLSRVGDYSAISVDPDDGVTFWAANEYKANSSFNTGIAEFGISPQGAAPSPGFAGRAAGLVNSDAFLLDNSSLPPISAAVQVELQLSSLDWLFSSSRAKDRDTLFAGLVSSHSTESTLLKSRDRRTPVWDDTLSL